MVERVLGPYGCCQSEDWPEDEGEKVREDKREDRCSLGGKVSPVAKRSRPNSVQTRRKAALSPLNHHHLCFLFQGRPAPGPCPPPMGPPSPLFSPPQVQP